MSAHNPHERLAPRAVRFTRFSNTGGEPLTKIFSLAEDGSLKKATHAIMAQGMAATVTAESATAFARLLLEVDHHEALAFGTFDRDEVQIVTDALVHKTRGAVSRTRNYVKFRAAASILMIDHDATNDSTLTPSALRDILIAICPPLAEAPVVAVASASSFITTPIPVPN